MKVDLSEVQAVFGLLSLLFKRGKVRAVSEAALRAVNAYDDMKDVARKIDATPVDGTTVLTYEESQRMRTLLNACIDVKEAVFALVNK